MFVQIIEGTTKDRDALVAAGDAWQEEVRDACWSDPRRRPGI